MLLHRINTKKDTVKCIFVFFVSWSNWKIEVNTFDLNEIPMAKVIEFHEKLKNEWNRKYRVRTRDI